MTNLVHGKTPEQLAAEGHWNGELVEGAHERLFGLVEHYRKLRGISLADAVKVVHEDMQAGGFSAAQQACIDIYRRWRADLLGTGGATKGVSLAEFDVWMRTGQFGGCAAVAKPERPAAVLKLKSSKRQLAFADVMTRMDALVQAQGLSVARAAGALLNEACLSDSANPCPCRLALCSAMGRGGRPAEAGGAAAGLPSIDTMTKWYLRHRTGAVEAVDGAVDPAHKPKPWVSRKARWIRAAQSIKAANPSFTALAVHAALLKQWRDWWGSPVNRDEFVEEIERQSWKF